MLSRKKFEQPRKLLGIKTSIDIREAAQLQRQRFLHPFFLFLHRLQEIERLAPLEALHVPMRKRALDWISQEHEQFDLRIIFPNPLDGWFPININRRAFAGDGPAALEMKTAVKSIVICFSGETLFVIEKVQLLLIRQRDLRMFAQKIMQRGRPRFLCARNNEIESFDLSWFGSEHRDDDQSRAAPYRAQSHSFELEKKLARYLVDFFCNSGIRLAVSNSNGLCVDKVRSRRFRAG